MQATKTTSSKQSDGKFQDFALLCVKLTRLNKRRYSITLTITDKKKQISVLKNIEAWCDNVAIPKIFVQLNVLILINISTLFLQSSSFVSYFFA